MKQRDSKQRAFMSEQRSFARVDMHCGNKTISLTVIVTWHGIRFFQIMSDVRADIFQLEENNADDQPTIGAHADAKDELKNQDTQWINELRIALERGCDLGSIRNIGKCRPLVDDLRLSVWKVSRALRRFLISRITEDTGQRIKLLQFFSGMSQYQRCEPRLRIYRR